MVEAGLDVARLNFSHGNREIHAENAELVRRAASAAGRQVAILQDLPGPKIRIGRLEDDIAELKPGEKLVLMCGANSMVGNGERMAVSWSGLASAVDPEDIIYLADGAIRLRVQTVREGDGEVETAVEIGGTVASRQGLNIPGSTRGLPAVPEEDLDMLRFGESIGVDLVALSFVRTAEDVTSVRRHTRLPLIAKIEKPQAVDSAEEIIRAADCVMVARGDLGIELPIEDVPIVQKQLLRTAGQAGPPGHHRHPDARLDGQLLAPHPGRGGRRRQRDPRRHRRRDALPGDRDRVLSGRGGRDDGRGGRADRAHPSLPGLERGAGQTRRPRPGVHDRLQRLRRRPRPAPGRAGRAHAVGPLGPADLRPPAPGADLRAVARQGDRAPLQPDVGRAGRADAPPRGDRGPDRRRRQRVVELGWVKSGARVGITAGLPSGRPGTTSLFQIQRV